MSSEMQKDMVALLPRLRRFAYSLTGNLDRADDLVQDTCARALKNAHQWQAGTRLDSWMYCIAQNLWFDRVRAQKVRGEVVDLDTVNDVVGADGRDVTESRLTLEIVAKGISSLPSDQRLVIAYVCLDGLSYKEAAERLGVPIGTVMSRLARARRALHRVIAGGDGETEVEGSHD